MASEVDWVAVARRNSRSVQTTVGWIFWDPGAVARYGELGLPGPLGYIVARATPLLPAGPDAVIAAFGSISPGAIRWAVRAARRARHRPARRVAGPRRGGRRGPARARPGRGAALEELGPELWSVVDRLPTVGRVFFGAHLAMPRPDDPLLSGWHAVNCLREWRGDTHWALVVAAGLTGVEASCLHNAWLGYEPDWLPDVTGQQRRRDRRGGGRGSRPRAWPATATATDDGPRPAATARGRHRPGHDAAVGAAGRGAVDGVRRTARAAVRAAARAASTSPPGRTTSRRRGCDPTRPDIPGRRRASGSPVDSRPSPGRRDVQHQVDVGERRRVVGDVHGGAVAPPGP